MKVIIAGSRGITDERIVVEAVRESGFDLTEVVSGGARGVDRVGEHIAEQVLRCRCVRFEPDWDRYGRGAGYRRNAEMAEYADALVAVWDGASRGTNHMIDTMRRLGKKVYVAKTDHCYRGDGGMTSLPYDVWKGGVGVPGTWHGGVKADGTRTASICCPECKKIASLTDHEIRSCGIVKPSVVCPREGCDWHVFVQLEGWKQTPVG